jgi:hypothetical protein
VSTEALLATSSVVDVAAVDEPAADVVAELVAVVLVPLEVPVFTTAEYEVTVSVTSVPVKGSVPAWTVLRYWLVEKLSLSMR